jgi:hypothetical protein
MEATRGVRYSHSDLTGVKARREWNQEMLEIEVFVLVFASAYVAL